MFYGIVSLVCRTLNDKYVKMCYKETGKSQVITDVFIFTGI